MQIDRFEQGYANRMTDWSEFQIDDYMWDEFKESGDHIVPHPGEEHNNHCTLQDDYYNNKKRLNSVRNCPDSDIGARDIGNKDMICATVKLENHSWSCMLSDTCRSDSTKEMASLGDGNCFNGQNMDSMSNESSGHGVMLGNNDADASVNGSLCQFSLDISAANSDMELFTNDHEEEDSGLLSCYGWPDVGNFEDVDKMFRTCDSMFGQGDITTTTGDDFPWLPSSSEPIDGSEDALKSGFKSPNSELSKVKHEEAEFKFMPVSITPMVNGTDKAAAPDNYPTGFMPMGDSDYGNPGYSYGNLVDTNAEASMLMEQRVERPSHPSLNAPSVKLEEKSHSQHQTPATSDHLAVPKQLQNIQGGARSCSDSDSSCVLEGSSINTMSTDETSLEATTFRQLNYVMEQLDIRTKLCIRDSLYRLARSAEQRNKFENSNNCILDGSDRSEAQTTGDTNKSVVFMDIETDTNPIDRSIAHLLFHRPKDPAEGIKFTRVSKHSVHSAC